MKICMLCWQIPVGLILCLLIVGILALPVAAPIMFGKYTWNNPDGDECWVRSDEEQASTQKSDFGSYETQVNVAALWHQWFYVNFVASIVLSAVPVFVIPCVYFIINGCCSDGDCIKYILGFLLLPLLNLWALGMVVMNLVSAIWGSKLLSSADG